MKKLKNGSMEEIMKIAKFNLFSNCLTLFVKKNQFIACTRKKKYLRFTGSQTMPGLKKKEKSEAFQLLPLPCLRWSGLVIDGLRNS